MLTYMDNMYMPPDDAQDQSATRPIGYPHPGQTAPASGPQGNRGTRRARHWGIGIAAGALLLCGGAAAGVALSTSSPATGPSGQAAVLNSTLSSASSPMSAATASALTGTSASPAPQAASVTARCRRAEARLRAAGRPGAARAVTQACRLHALRLRGVRLLGGIHGQFTFETKTGPRTLAYERGVVESVSGTSVVVRAQDGTTWTWNLVSNSVVRENGQRSAASALATGENVFAGGPVSGSTYDARLIVIRKNTSSPAPAS
jgi:hypothetical protein